MPPEDPGTAEEGTTMTAPTSTTAGTTVTAGTSATTATARAVHPRTGPVAAVWTLALLAGASFWAAVGTTASLAWSTGGTGGRLVSAALLAGLSQAALVALWLVATYEVEGRPASGPGARFTGAAAPSPHGPRRASARRALPPAPRRPPAAAAATPGPLPGR